MLLPRVGVEAHAVDVEGMRIHQSLTPLVGLIAVQALLNHPVALHTCELIDAGDRGNLAIRIKIARHVDRANQLGAQIAQAFIDLRQRWSRALRAATRRRSVCEREQRVRRSLAPRLHQRTGHTKEPKQAQRVYCSLSKRLPVSSCVMTDSRAVC